MPVLSNFQGIVIKMYFLQGEHNPPHIHAFYGSDVASVDCLNGELTDGYLPPKVLKLVQLWVKLHHEELIEIWVSQEFRRIPGLD